MTAQLPAPSAQILGGIQVDKSFADFVVNVGCTAVFPPDASDTPTGCTLPATCTDASCVPVACIPQACLARGVTTAALASYKIYPNVPTADFLSPEQSLYNLLNIYFNGSPAASSFGGTQGTTPLNYLQLYSQDIQYANASVNAPAQVTEAGGVTVSTTAQTMLNLASQELLTIAEPALPAITPGGIVPGTLQPGEWATIYGSNLAGGTANWTGNFPVSLGGTTVTIGGAAAYLSFVSPGQINLQVPNLTATGARARGGYHRQRQYPTANATLASFSPSFFLLDSKHVAGIILRANGAYDIIGPTGTSLGYPTVAARAGDMVALFGTGFGPTNPAVAPGVPFSGAAATTNAVAIGINNVTVIPAFAGLSGAGLYQINLTVPPGLGSGDVSLQASVGGVQTPSGVVIFGAVGTSCTRDARTLESTGAQKGDWLEFSPPLRNFVPVPFLPCRISSDHCPPRGQGNTRACRVETHLDARDRGCHHDPRVCVGGEIGGIALRLLARRIHMRLRALVVLMLAPALVAQTPRRPRGIYALVDTQKLIDQLQQTNPSITTAQLDVYFNGLYQDLLSNPAVSGLTLQVHWDWLNPNPPGAANPYLWNIVDDAFNQAAAWDAQNPGQTPKTIQIIATPGFNSPPWMLDQIPSCDGLFQSPVQTPPSTCGNDDHKGLQRVQRRPRAPLAVERLLQELLANVSDGIQCALWVKPGVRVHRRRRPHGCVGGDHYGQRCRLE